MQHEENNAISQRVKMQGYRPICDASGEFGYSLSALFPLGISWHKMIGQHYRRNEGQVSLISLLPKKLINRFSPANSLGIASTAKRSI